MLSQILPKCRWLVLAALISAILITLIGLSRDVVLADECTIITTTTCTIVPDPLNSPASFNVSVRGFVPETAVQLKGYTAPGAFVIVTESGDVVGATTADVNGQFDFTLHALQAGSPHLRG